MILLHRTSSHKNFTSLIWNTDLYSFKCNIRMIHKFFPDPKNWMWTKSIKGRMREYLNLIEISVFLSDCLWKFLRVIELSGRENDRSYCGRMKTRGFLDTMCFSWSGVHQFVNTSSFFIFQNSLRFSLKYYF